MGSVTYSTGSWEVVISWTSNYGDKNAKLTIDVKKNDNWNTFQVVMRYATSNRYNSGDLIPVGKQYFLYVYSGGSYSTQRGPFNVDPAPEPTYTITFNANGGSGAPDSQTKKQNVGIYLSTTRPTLTGYDFVQWNTSSGGYGTPYDPGEWYNSNSDLYLYAIWRQKTYAINYYANASGVSQMPSNQTKYYDSPITIGSAPRLTGHSFVRWDTSPSGNGNQYAPGERYNQNTGLDLYAIWKADTYTITFNANGGSGGPSTQTKTYGVGMNLTNSKPSRSGYSFVNWNTQANGSGTPYSAGEYYTREGTITLYAQWTPNTYYVTYKPNGAPGSDQTFSVLYDSNFYAKDNLFSYAGREFVGWNEQANGQGTDWTNEIYTPWQWKRTSHLILYAQWTLKTYLITYSSNTTDPVTGLPDSELKTYGQTYYLKSAPSRTGYNFKEWNTDPNGNGTSYRVGDPYTANRELDVYAIWTRITYEIKYFAEGATNIPSTTIKTYGVTANISDKIPQKIGYHFIRWYNRNGDYFYPKDPYTLNAGQNLYAEFQNNIYHIRYNANDGSGVMPDQDMICNSEEVQVLNTNQFTRNGYSFKGWSYSKTGAVDFVNEQPLVDDLTKEHNAIINLYAIWEAFVYTITFDSNGGSGGPTSISKTHDITITLPVDIPVLDGFDFVNWNTSKDGNGNSYRAGSEYTLEGTRTLYAQWKIKEYDIIYEKNTPDQVYNMPQNGKKKHNENYVIVGSPTKDDSDFVDWNTKNNGTGTWMHAGDVYDKNASLRLFAIWKLKRYIITYDTVGGIPQIEQQTKKHGINLALSSTTPQKTGYTFQYWIGKDQNYKVGDVYSANHSDNLVAYYSVNKYIIRYDPNTGVGTMTDQSVYYDIEATLSNNKFTKTDYKFLGWSKQKSATVPEYTNQEKIKNLSAIDGEIVVLYAVWGKNNILITYDASSNGGTCDVKNVQIQVGGFINDLPIAIKKYYDFIGWFTDKVGGTQITNKTTFSVPATIYAQFKFAASMWITVEGTPRHGIPFVKIDGVWRRGTAFNKQSTWKQGK